MSVEYCVRAVRRRARLVVAIVVVCVVAGFAVAFALPTKYQSTTSLYVSTRSNASADASSAYEGGLLSQQRVHTYTQLATSPRVVGEVKSRLGLDESLQQIESEISASAEVDSVLITISVTDVDAARSTQMANAVSDSMVTLIGELESTSAPGQVAPVSVRSVQPAVLADAPVGPPKTYIVLLAIVGGAVLAFGAALLRERLDSSLKDDAEIHERTGLPVLVRTPPLVDAAQDRMTFPPIYSEAIRRLKFNVQCLDLDAQPKVVLVTSALPAEGKTTTAAGLATALADGGSRVLLLEADLRQPRLARAFGVREEVGLTSVLSGRIEWHQAVQSLSAEGLSVLVSGPVPSNPNEVLASGQMAEFLMEMRRQFTYVVIDSPPLVPVSDAAALAQLSDACVVVYRHARTSGRELAEAVEMIRRVSTAPAGVAVSGDPAAETRGSYGSYRPKALVVGSTSPAGPPSASPRRRPSPTATGSHSASGNRNAASTTGQGAARRSPGSALAPNPLTEPQPQQRPGNGNGNGNGRRLYSR